jgi:Protein of unknown function (DUF3489)
MTSNEEQATTQNNGSAASPKPTTKANGSPRKRHVAPAKRTVGKTASSAKRAKTPKQAKSTKAGRGTRPGSKAEKILALLKRSKGATLKELMKATGWQAHSVRGFLSGMVGKKMGLNVASAKTDDGERTYSVKA